MKFLHAAIVSFAWFVAALLLAHRADGATPEEASYLINMTDGTGGSATFIHPFIAVTNHHVAGNPGNRGTLKHQFGRVVSGQVVASDSNADLALVLVQEAQPFVELAEQGPQRGQQLKMCGYCAPQRILKAGTGTIQGGYMAHGRGVITNICSVVSISGDSGCGLFNEQGQLVSVNWGSDSSNGGNSLSTAVEHVKQLGERWATTNLPQERWQEVQCFGGRCGPGGCQPQQPQYGGGYGVQPKFPVLPPSQQQPPALLPVPPQQPLAPAPQKPAPATPMPAETDYAKLADAFADKLAKDERFRGPPGAKGDKGADGKGGAVDIDAIAAAVVLRLPPVRLNIRDDINGDGVMSEDETFRLTAPLGEALELEVTGGIDARKKR